MTRDATATGTALAGLKPLYVRFEMPHEGRQIAAVRFGAHEYTDWQLTTARSELEKTLDQYTAPDGTPHNGVPNVLPQFEHSPSLDGYAPVLQVIKEGMFSPCLQHKLVTTVAPRYARGAKVEMQFNTTGINGVSITATHDNAFELYDVFQPHQETMLEEVRVNHITYRLEKQQPHTIVELDFPDQEALGDHVDVWRRLCDLTGFYLDA
jgi:hypothetical protein